MKRIAALLTALLFSAFAGISYITPKEDVFSYGEEAYYQVPGEEGDIMYKQLYQSVYGGSDEAVERCDLTRVQEQRDGWVTISERCGSGTSISSILWEPVFVDDTVQVDIRDADTIVYTLSAEKNIFAPINGEINTSHYACEYGHKMDYIASLSDGDSYLVRIEGAKCWYCCANKTEPEDGRYTATAGTLFGQTMRTGDMLCVGKAGTTITVMRNPKN